VRWIRYLQRALTNRALENKVQLWAIYPGLSEDFCAEKIMLLKFMQILVDDQGTFCLVCAFYFTSCYNSNELPQSGMSQYNGLKVQS